MASETRERLPRLLVLSSWRLACALRAPPTPISVVYREWSYTEASFDQLFKRGDLSATEYAKLLEACNFLKSPADLKMLFGHSF